MLQFELIKCSIIITIFGFHCHSYSNDDDMLFNLPIENEQFRIDRKLYSERIEIHCKNNRDSWVNFLNQEVNRPKQLAVFGDLRSYRPKKDLDDLESPFKDVLFSNCSFFKDINILNDILVPLRSENLTSVSFKSTKSKIFKENFRGLKAVELKFLDGLFNVEEDLLYETEFKKLYFNSNELLSIPDDFFKQSTDLEELIITNTTLKKIKSSYLSGLWNLKNLLIFENEIEEIESGSFNTLLELNLLKINSNNLRTLPSDIFEKLHELKILILENNKFNYLPYDLLGNNSELQVFKLSQNQGKLKTLSSKFFKNLTYLEDIDLKNNNFSNIPENLFSETYSLLRLNFSNNNLTTLPSNIFEKTKRLKLLDFSKNNLISLPDEIFKNTNLEFIDLSNNKLTVLPSTIGLYSLKVLNVSFNNLSQINKDFCKKSINLKYLYASHNKLTLFTEGSEVASLQKCFSIIEMDVSHNNITVFSVLNNQKILNFDGNQITELKSSAFTRQAYPKRPQNIMYLQNNNITTLSFKNIDWEVSTWLRDKSNVIEGKDIYLNNNPLNCDCRILHFLYFFEGKLDNLVYKTIKINANNLTCAEPPELKYRQVTSLSSEEIKCSMNCSNICHCIDYPGKLHLVIDCSNKHLTSVPDVFSEFLQQYQLKNYSLEFNLSRNKFEKTPSMKKFDSMKVISIDLSNNFITDVTLDIFTTTLKKLYLNDNKISELDFKVVKYFKKNILYLPSLYLHNNEWRCICDNFNFVTLVRSYPMIFGLSNKLTCHDTGVEFSTIGPSDLCKNSQLIIIIISLSIAGFLGIVGCLAAVFYKYEMKIKIWLYSKQWCLRFITEEELDKDKKYDAFISYSHEDRDFVHEEIVKTLEQSAESFKLCLHDRDWLAGEWIPHQIEDSIQNSKRTIIVLSQNYLKSCWSKMEFFIAYKQTVKERRTHLIIILLEDIGDTKILTPEIKSYLSVNTYLKSDDPKFYEKLKLALPPRHNLSNCRRKSKKSRVMALRKFDLYQDEHRKELKNEIPLKNISIASERFLIEAESEVGVTFTTENTAV